MGKPKPVPAIILLREILSYDSISGEIRQRKTINGLCAGKLRGYKRPDGYVYLRVHNSEYKAHRIAWALYYGEEPPPIIDHINRIRTDNSIANLRGVGARDNVLNSAQYDRRGKHIGTTRHKKSRKWQAQIGFRSKPNGMRYLGLFETREEARQAYLKALRELVS